MEQRRLILDLVGTFATTALALASIGLYGVMAYSVVTRRRELCIRMALGAASRDVIRRIVGDGLRLMSLGVLLGLAGAIAVARLLTSQLYQVSAYDPLVIGATILAVALVVLFACWVPAVRATRLNPVAALRD
jgi:putative ABC transport system permease protein